MNFKAISSNLFLQISDVGSNNSGFYQLNAVLTHKGRSSSSGHYVAWVRRTQSNIISSISRFSDEVLL